MGVSKVVYDGNTLIDLTSDTVTADTLAAGVTAHGADGEEIVGTAISIVEQGTSGIWTYRKWSDGTAECWGTKDYSSQSITSAYGYAYYKMSDTLSYPFTFTETPKVLVNNNAGNGLVNIQPCWVATSLVQFYFISATSDTLKVSADMYIIGKWK